MPGWQALHGELSDRGLTVVTVALDADPVKARPFSDAAAPTHPSLVDTSHVCDELFGFDNVPMAVWIDEDGMLVRPAESATIEQSALRGMDIPADADDRISRTLREVQKIPDRAQEYRAAIVDWVTNGAASRFALTPDEVIARSKPRTGDHARAAACFELGHHLLGTVGHDAAVPWWREAHRLHPENWTYKRQAWTLVTTEGDAEPDLLQPPNDVYEGSWLEDVVTLGGGEAYGTEPRL